MTKPTQQPTAAVTYRHDWAARLARAETDLGLTAGSLAITDATVTGPASATITGTDHTGTYVTFKLAAPGITTATDLTLTTTATLSNGDTDVEDLVVGITPG